MAAPIMLAAGVAASVGIEYAWHRLKGDKASTKELLMAGALGAVPVSKLRALRAPLRALRYRAYRHTDDVRHLVFAGTRVVKDPVIARMGAYGPYVAAAWIGAPIVQYGKGLVKREIFSQGYDLVIGQIRESGKGTVSRGRDGTHPFLSRRSSRGLSLGTLSRKSRGGSKYRR